jgi:hypothetical protein
LKGAGSGPEVRRSSGRQNNNSHSSNKPICSPQLAMISVLTSPPIG